MKTPFTATKSVCLVLLGTLVLLPLSAFGQVYQACSFEGIGVYNAPPTGVCGEDGVVSFAPPSEISACLDSFYLDPTNATQYLESLIKLTQDYYIFNDIAINPTASVPAITPFNFPIYDIRVDIVADMMDLLTKVQQEGQASPNLFLEVNEIYAKLYDAHVAINNDIDTAGLLDYRDVYILHEEVLKGDATTVVLSVPFPSDEFSLSATLVHEDNTTETLLIVQIGGQSPQDFFISLANMPTGMAPLKSLGPRVQVIVASITSGEGVFSGRLPAEADLSKFLDDSIDIVYENGSTSTWYLTQFVPCPITQNLTTADIEAELSQPGFLYANFDNITDTLVTAITKKKDKAKKPPVIEVSPTTSTRTMEGVEFVMVNDFLGYAIMDDFAVFKLETFVGEVMNNTESFLDAWTSMSNDAAANGVTKLIIDINKNGGGTVTLAYDLVIAMYPDAQWDELANPYDLVFSEASDAYWNYISPFLASLGGENVTENLTDLLNSDPDSIVEKMARLVTAVSTFEALIPELKSVVDVFEYIADNIVARGSASEVELSILIQQILAVRAIGGTVAGSGIGFFFGQYPTEHNRGGILNNYTAPFYMLDPGTFVTKRQIYRDAENPFQFEEYLILSDGLFVGSSANTFHTTASQLAKLREGSVPPLHTVSFGGTGDIKDAAISQFAGGFVREADLTGLYVPEIILVLLYILVLGSGDLEDALLEVLLAFVDTVPEPCYFCNAPPQLTFSQMYSLVVGEESIPMEYVDLRPDFYIPQWPFATTFSNGGDLKVLYELTSKFFGQQTMTPDDGEVIESLDETGMPPVEDSKDVEEKSVTVKDYET